jgi:nucleoid-associated protein YgaU
MGLREKYAWTVQVAKDMNMQGNFEEREGKLYIKGTTSTQASANKIWDAIKTIPEWPKEIVADIQSTGLGEAAAKAAAMSTYTVQAGDTLSKIAKERLGNANAYMQIFDANKDQLTDPNKIKPGQVLRIPQGA